MLYRVLLALSLALLTTSCGPPGPKKYSAVKTRACIASRRVRVVAPAASDFVAHSALGGAFRAKLPHNAVTIAFGSDAGNARQLDNAYRRVAGKNIRSVIDDVLRADGNAVMIWDRHPSDHDLALVQGCLTT